MAARTRLALTTAIALSGSVGGFSGTNALGGRRRRSHDPDRGTGPTSATSWRATPRRWAAARPRTTRRSSRQTAPSPPTTSAVRSTGRFSDREARCRAGPAGPPGSHRGLLPGREPPRRHRLATRPDGDNRAGPGGRPGSAPIGHGGRYDDVYVKTADGWRFKSRTVTMPSPAARRRALVERVTARRILHDQRRRQAPLHGCRSRPHDRVHSRMDDERRDLGTAAARVLVALSHGDARSARTGRVGDDRRRVVSRTPRTDIGELLEHLNLTGVVLVGWSMGVREVITYVATSGTSRIAALAFVEGNLWPQGALEPALENLRRMQADRKPFTRDFVKSMYVQPQTEAYLDRVTEMSLKTPTDAAAMLMFANAFGKDTDMRPLFAKLDARALRRRAVQETAGRGAQGRCPRRDRVRRWRGPRPLRRSGGQVQRDARALHPHPRRPLTRRNWYMAAGL